MRFKGTWILLLVCLALGCFIYFYEIKGGEEREKAKEAEKRFWMIEGNQIKQIELLPPDETIVAARKNADEWIIQKPRELEADSDELNQLAGKAAELKFESVLEETDPDLSAFGLDPARSSVVITTETGEKHSLYIGDTNPTGSRTYAKVSGRDEIFLAPASLYATFDKKLEELRNHSVLNFEQSETKTLHITNPKGTISLVKDENDQWWFEGENRIAADSPAVRGILNALSFGKIPEFFDEDPEQFRNLGLDKPRLDVRITYGTDKAIKHLSIGSKKSDLRSKEMRSASEPSEAPLYLAKDASRPELFFVDEELFDKLNTSLNDLRDKAIATFQRWDVDSIQLDNIQGNFSFTKDGGEWFFGDDKKKADFDAVSAILDALESDATDWIDKPKALSAYGLDNPAVHVVLRQGVKILTECSFGQTAEDKIYAQTSGDRTIKVVNADNYANLAKGEADFIEKETTPEPGPETDEE
ncbi:MAG: DUF4340 domain-containing protein [Acidobacteriota bacterium]